MSGPGPSTREIISAVTAASSAGDHVRRNSEQSAELHTSATPYFGASNEIDEGSESYEMPTPPYSTWPLPIQEAARLAAHRHLQRIKPPPVTPVDVSLLELTSSDENVAPHSSNRIVLLSRKQRARRGRERSTRPANHDRTSDVSLKDIVASLIELESRFSNKIENIKLRAASPRVRHEDTSPMVAAYQSQARGESTCTRELLDTTQSTSLAKILKPAIFVAIGMLCARPESRILFETLLRKQRLDPVLVAICALFALYIGAVAQNMPQQLSVLGGDVLSFEDALGTAIKVPYSTYSHIRMFKAFLEVHFEEKPGLQKVLNGEYQLFDLHGSVAHEISQQDWSVVISKRSRVIMNMLFAAREMICVDCLKPLLETNEGAREDSITLNCSVCKHKYRRVLSDGVNVPLDVVSAPDFGRVHEFRYIGSALEDSEAIADEPERIQYPSTTDTGIRARLPFKHMSLMTLRDQANTEDKGAEAKKAADERQEEGEEKSRKVDAVHVATTRDRHREYDSDGYMNPQTVARDITRGYVEIDFPTTFEWEQYQREKAQAAKAKADKLADQLHRQKGGKRYLERKVEILTREKLAAEATERLARDRPVPQPIDLRPDPRLTTRNPGADAIRRTQEEASRRQQSRRDDETSFEYQREQWRGRRERDFISSNPLAKYLNAAFEEGIYHPGLSTTKRKSAMLQQQLDEIMMKYSVSVGEKE